jgi:hypothetical protein
VGSQSPSAAAAYRFPSAREPPTGRIAPDRVTFAAPRDLPQPNPSEVPHHLRDIDRALRGDEMLPQARAGVTLVI